MDIAEDVKGPYASSPADIRATAENIAENYSFDPSILAGAICAALVSERERCAKVADDVMQKSMADDGATDEWDDRYRAALLDIAMMEPTPAALRAAQTDTDPDIARVVHENRAKLYSEPF